MKGKIGILCGAMLTVLLCLGVTPGTVGAVERAAAHDPSIVETTDADGQTVYYVFGSHMAVASSSDLMNWHQLSEKENDINSSLFGIMENGAVTVAPYTKAFENSMYSGTVPVSQTVSESKTAEFSHYNAELFSVGADDTDGIAGNLWAPDVIYNPSMGKWCMYLSLNGKDNSQQSVIVLLTADAVTGPYVYQAPVVFGRVSQSATAANYWKNTDMPLIYGDLDAMPARYRNTSATDWANYYPNVIDPCVFYDEEGMLWMAYGSWSGGIYMLKLDEKTGLRDYTVSYADEVAGNGIDNLTSTKAQLGKDVSEDPYYGKRIAGGYYVSGEGAFIQYIDGRYYLFLSYGDLGSKGNYQMRIFSSANPDGPYRDTKGVSAVYDKFYVNYNATYCNIGGVSDIGAPSDTRGSRLMTNYKWDTMDRGELSQGHNSVLSTKAGNFVVYHTRFDDDDPWHQIRVHQIYTTKDGGLVAAPYEYDAAVTDKTSYTGKEVSGGYRILFQNYDTNKRYNEVTKKEDTTTDGLECETPVSMSLGTDSTLYADNKAIGSYQIQGKEITLTIDKNYESGRYVGEYQGLLIEQNTGDGIRTCFTAIDMKTGLSVWGTQDKKEYDMSAVRWTTSSFTYDGTDKQVVLTGLPEGLTAVYSGNRATNAGSYTAEAVFTGDSGKYVMPEKQTLTWKIEKAQAVLSASKTSWTVTYGAKPFALNVKATAGCTLSYRTENDKVIAVSSDGKVSVKGCGKAAVTVTAGSQNHKQASMQITVTVNPKKASFTNVSSPKRGVLLLKWKRDKQADGYRIQYSTSRKMKAKTTKTVVIKKNKTTSWKKSGLKKGKKYYVRIQSYKNGGCYGAWSKIKTVKVRL